MKTSKLESSFYEDSIQTNTSQPLLNDSPDLESAVGPHKTLWKHHSIPCRTTTTLTMITFMIMTMAMTMTMTMTMTKGTVDHNHNHTAPILKVPSRYKKPCATIMPCKTSICGLSGEHIQPFQRWKFLFTKVEERGLRTKYEMLLLNLLEKPSFRSPSMECPSWYSDYNS